eukprot:9005381-Lingulodinium_polyedra.AAC.1
MLNDVRRKKEVNIKQCVAAERKEVDVAKKFEVHQWVSNAVFPLPRGQTYLRIGPWPCDGS